MAESVPDAGAEDREQPRPGFTVEANRQFLGFQKVETTKVDETKPWKPALEVRVTNADGSIEEGVDANTAFFTFHGGTEGARDLTVTAAAAGHVDSLHIRGTEAGSHFDYPSVEELFEDVAERIPDNVATDPGVSAFDVEMGKPMGREGIASRAELLADETIRGEDVVSADLAREEVLALNREGAPEAKKAFIEKFRRDNPDSRIQFQLVRGDVLVPVVVAPKRETTKLFLVFGPDATGDKKTLYTAAPGRNMPRHPNPGQHRNKEGVLNDSTFNESANAWFDTVMLVGK